MEWHCHYHKLFVIKQGFHSHGLVALQLALCNNTFPNLKPFLNRLLPTQSQSYFKQQFKWYCDLLESVENLGVEHIFLLRTSSQVNNYFIAYSNDCILFDLFFSKLFSSLKPKSLCSDLNKEIGAAGFETVKCRAWIGPSKSLSQTECRWWVRECWEVRLELCISQQGGILGGLFPPWMDFPWIAGCIASYLHLRNSAACSAIGSTEHISRRVPQHSKSSQRMLHGLQWEISCLVPQMEKAKGRIWGNTADSLSWLRTSQSPFQSDQCLLTVAFREHTPTLPWCITHKLVGGMGVMKKMSKSQWEKNP